MTTEIVEDLCARLQEIDSLAREAKELKQHVFRLDHVEKELVTKQQEVLTLCRRLDIVSPGNAGGEYRLSNVLGEIWKKARTA
jgi:hypothetical protein